VRIDIVTLFSEVFTTPLQQGLVGKAIASGAVAVGFVDPRAFTQDRHRTVDDTPSGGGGGMVMKVEPAAAAIRAAKARGGGRVLLLSPQGRPLGQSDLRIWATLDHLVMVCGRYEGFDERIRALADEEVSLGDFVLTGGEYAALAIADGVVRLLPGTLGNVLSPENDSFSDGLLEHPQYTRPVEFEGASVPDVLMSGNHAEIEAWRRAQSLARTRARRPDLLARRSFTAAERKVLVAADRRARLEIGIVGPASRAGLIERLGRIASAYGVETVHAFADRAALARYLADRPGLRVATASPEPVLDAPLETPQTAPDLLVLGHDLTERRGKHLVLAPGIGAILPIIRVGTAANDLPLEAALAIALDRLIGEG
jgi:tRNA (guanine37-N1)-methyltransferase